MGEHSLSKTHKRTFNKTMAIAIASAVTIGGVAVPQAGAVAGHVGVDYWRDESGQNNPKNLTPNVVNGNVPTWGAPYPGGGIYTDIPTSDGTLTGFSGVYGGYTAGTALENSDFIYHDPALIRDMKTSGIREDVAPQRDMSMDSKKMLYVAYSFANDVAKNEGLSQAARDKLLQSGYKGKFLEDDILTKIIWGGGPGHDNLVFDKKPSLEEIRSNAESGKPLVITNADYVAYAAARLAGSIYTLDGGAKPIGIIRGGEDRPLTFDDMLDKDIVKEVFSDLDDQGDDENIYNAALANRSSLMNAMINIARGVSDEEINNSNLKVYKSPDLLQPTFFSLSNSSPAPVEKLPQPEPETPDTHSDIFIDGTPDVANDGTVTLHRNDGEDITFKVPTGSKVEVNKDGDLVITNPGKKPEIVKLKHTTVTESGEPGTPDHKITITDEDGKTHEFGTYDKYLKSVKDDGKGNYTFIMNDGEKLGPIQLGDDITNIVDDGKGNLIVTHKDGSKDTVPLTHTTITEKGKPGDPDYAVTITTPDGKKITLDGYDNYVESIKKQPNGDYLVKRNDGTEWTIKLSDIRDDIKDLKGKDAEQDKRLDDLENRVDGIDEEIENLGDRITKNEGAIEDHRKSINDLNQEVGGINNELGDIKDELARLDGQDIKEVRDNGDGTYTLIRNNGDEVTGTIDTSGDIKSITDNGDGTITLTKNDGSTEVVDLTHTTVETKGEPGDKDYTVTITTPDGNKVTLNGSNTYPTEVKDNGDGTYTIILNDGSEVEGKIGDGQDIKELVPNEDGTMTIIHKDGSESVVDLKQVEITEENKGTPEHTVTITSPNGDSVTFNVFDKYVTNVVKNEDGNYDIFRSDVDGGNTVWKTIVLSDLRDKISALEDRADQLEEKDADLQRQIDELKGRLDNAEKEIESLKDRTSDLEKAVAKINARLSVIELNITALEGRMDALEGRVDTVENTQHAWAQCFSGILGTAIPLLAAAPLVAGSNIQIPGAAQWNNQIQRTLGIYNEKLNRMAGQYSGVIKAAATILGVAGTIGLGVHTAKACGPYSKTDAMKETKAGKLSSKLTAKREGSSAKREESSEGSSREK